MLVVVSADGAQLDPGSVSLGVARHWAEADSAVLFVDADASGSQLAARLGSVDHAEYSPAERGLPSLMVARKPLNLRLLAQHCYRLNTDAGSLWALLGPRHPDGAAHAARWLAKRFDDLAAMDAQRTSVVSSSLQAGFDHLALWGAAPLMAVLAPVPNVEAARALRTQCQEVGLWGLGGGRRVLIVEGGTTLGNEEIGREAGMSVLGRLPVIDDEKILTLKGGRRPERAFLNTLKKIADDLLTMSIQAAARRAAAASSEGEPMAEPDMRRAGRPTVPAVNGEHQGSALLSQPVPWAPAREDV